MTEEQKKKCEEIIYSNIIVVTAANIRSDIPIEITINLIISLAKVFNKKITKEKAFYIINEIVKNDYYKLYLHSSCYTAVANFIKNIGWEIANYFDNENNNNNNKINNVVENTAKEKIMSNNDELTLNLLIIGQTGVGKSSLINALVGKEIEKMGVGKPKITKGIFNYEAEIDGKKVIIHDSWGLEIGADEEWEKIIKNALKERSADKDIKDWFHSVTYCIQSGGLKIQDFDIKMIKLFMDKKYNVIVALTKADQIGTAKREEFINIIKEEVKKATEKDITVIPLSADPMQLDHMTEKPKPFGLEEYKAAILISWEKIFMDRMPLHIIEKLKKDIENAKKNSPNRKLKDDDDLKILAKEIDEYFINIINKKLPIHIKENFEKYNKITENIININANIDISNFYSKKNIDPHTYIYDLIGFNLFHIFDHIKDLVRYLGVKADIEKYINDFKDKRIEEAKKYISKKEFEDNIRKIIIYNLENKNKN